MPHIPRQQPARPVAQPPPATETKPAESKEPQGKKLRMGPGKINMHSYEPNFNNITRALFGRDAGHVDPDSR